MDTESQPSIVSRLDDMQQRLHDVWAQAVDSATPDLIPASPALAAIGSAVEDLHVAAEEVGSAAQKLEAERLRYAEMFQLAPNGYLVTDTDTVIVEANQAASEILGRPASALVGLPFSSFVASEQRALVDGMEASSRSAGHPSSVDDVAMTSSNGALRVSLRCAPTRDVGGEVTGFRWVIHDLTERFREEERRRVAQQLETERLRDVASHRQRLDEAKSQFLNLASHELRSPLTILGGYLSMMAEGTFGQLAEPMAHVVALLTAKTREMNALVNDLLEAARLEEGATSLTAMPVDLIEVVAQVVEDWRPLVRPGQHIEISAPDSPLVVEADSARLRTILVNLISNAIKYSPEHTEIVCSVTSGRANVRVAVRDEGMGVSAKDRGILFTRFGRIVTPATSHIPGTGLGLYLARELARMHGGDVTLEGTGPGSTFVLTLPRHRPRAAS